MAYTQATPDRANILLSGPMYYGPSYAQRIEWFYPASFNPATNSGTPAQGGKYPILVYFYGGGWNKGRPDQILLTSPSEPVAADIIADEGTYEVIVCAICVRQNSTSTVGPPITMAETSYNAGMDNGIDGMPMSLRAVADEIQQDCRMGLSYLRTYAPVWFPDADPDNIILFGGSAGAFKAQFCGYCRSIPYANGRATFGLDYYANNDPSDGVVGLVTYWAMGDIRNLDESDSSLVARGLYGRTVDEFDDAMPEDVQLCGSPHIYIEEFGGKPTILHYTTLPTGGGTWGVHDSDNAAQLIQSLDLVGQPWSYYNDAFAGKSAAINWTAIWAEMKQMWAGTFAGSGQVGAP